MKEPNKRPSIHISGGKQTLTLHNPVMGASGAFGFGGEYAKLVELDLLGAWVTNPISLNPRRPASGTRIIPLDSGVLVHTGLPNPGLYKAFRQYGTRWKNSPVPVIVHLIGTSPEEISECAIILEGHEEIAAIEIGLNDSAAYREVRAIVGAARSKTQLPILVQLPLASAPLVALPAFEAGADALVIAAPPRGTARDPLTGRLIGGRLYGPPVKAQALRATGLIASQVKAPIIGCGGIHSPDDARDYLEAGAAAVQIDSVVWVRPALVSLIARDLGGLEMTRPAGSLPDEWAHNTTLPNASTRASIFPSVMPLPPFTPPDDLP
ncbi:dihydroorotate dehydrogenase (NAD+) catalytic subunit [Anaerolineae bacterium]|nr:dihydroorotate dehydrogenase (NAD+) catalytic subunit [Anaerolineae bacterium]